MAHSIERPGPGRSLSAKILGLTVIFLLLGEILIFVPSIARFRLSYLEELIASAHVASLVTRGHGEPLEPELESTLLEYVGARAVTLWRPDAAVMLGRIEPVDRVYDLRERNPIILMLDAIETLTLSDRLIRVVGASPHQSGVTVDVITAEAPMRSEMIGYARRILILSLVLSLIVASLLFASLRSMIVIPLATITERLSEFRRRPEDGSLEWQVGPGRGDEIHIVERELIEMQRGLRSALMQKTRLAALGAAIGQVSHDLKNILASAVLISDRLEGSADPEVRKVAPRLVETLERAVRLCTDTLRFAREQPRSPELARFHLRDLINEAAVAASASAAPIAGSADTGAMAAPASAARLTVENAIDAGLQVIADRDQLFRVLLNLARNSDEAADGEPCRMAFTAQVEDDAVTISVRDNGPGIAPTVLPRLFETFSVSGKPDGSGLGLAICREIMRAHGGDIELVETGPEGTAFSLRLPRREDATAKVGM
jgi:signal transduction histidine kinase